jgi:hypothetical protein
MIGGGAALVTALAAVVGMLNQLGFVENRPSGPNGAKAPASRSTDAPSETAPVAANNVALAIKRLHLQRRSPHPSPARRST